MEAAIKLAGKAMELTGKSQDSAYLIFCQYLM